MQASSWSRVASLLPLLSWLMLVPACGGGDPDPDQGVMPDGSTDGSTDAPVEDADVDAGGHLDGDVDAGMDGGALEPGVLDVLVVDEDDLDFGEWTCGAPAPAARTVRVENTGPSPAVFGVRRFPEYQEWFSYTGPSGGELAPGETTTFMVQPVLPASELLSPTSASEVVATINVDPHHGAIGGRTVSPRLRRVGARFFAGGEFDLGDVPVGTPGGGSFGVTNLHADPVTLRVVRHLDPEITATIAGETGGEITLGAFETRMGTFSYVAAGVGVAQGRVRFETDAPDCFPASHREASLTARAVTGSLRVSTGDLNLGTAACDELLPSETLTVTNGGAGVMNWTAELAAGVDSPYQISPSGGSLSAGASQAITVTPRRAPALVRNLPLSFGDFLIVTSDVAGEVPRTVELSHTVSGPAFEWTNSSEATLLANPGEQATAEFQLRNIGSASGTASVMVGGSSVVTLASATPVSVPAGASTSVSVRFEPTAELRGGVSSVYVSAPGACALPPNATAPRVVGQPRVAGLETPLTTLFLNTARCSQVLPPTAFPVTNTLSVPLDVALAVSGSFAVSLDGSPIGASVSFAPGQTRTFEVESTDTVTFGQTVGTLTMTPVGRLPLRIIFAAERQGAVLLTSAEALGSQHAGSVVSSIIHVYNAGNVPARLIVDDVATGEIASLTFPAGASGYERFRTVPAGAFTDVVQFTAQSDFVCNPSIDDAVVTGNGVVLPSSVSPTSMYLGSVFCQSPDLPRQSSVVRVRNHAAVPISYTTQIIGSPGAFVVNPPSGSIDANGYAEVIVTSLPVVYATPGSLQQILRVTTPSATHDIPLEVTVEGALYTAPASVALGSVAVGESSPLTLLGIGNGYGVGAPVSLVSGPASELDIVYFGQEQGVVFTPASSGMRTFEIAIAPPTGVAVCAPMPPNITVTASGVSTAYAVVTPTTLTLPSTRCGETPPPTGFAVDNVGVAPFTFTTALASMPWVGVSPASATVPVGGRQIVTVTPSAIPLGGYEPELLGNVLGFILTHSEVVSVLADGTFNPVTIQVPVRGDGWRVQGSGSAPLTMSTHSVFVSIGSTRLADGSLAYGFSPNTTADCTLEGSLSQPTGTRFEFTCENNPAPNSIQIGVSARTGSSPCVRAGVAFTYP